MEELTLRAEHLATAMNSLLPACQGNVRTDSAPQPEYCCEREQVVRRRMGSLKLRPTYRKLINHGWATSSVINLPIVIHHPHLEKTLFSIYFL